MLNDIFPRHTVYDAHSDLCHEAARGSSQNIFFFFVWLRTDAPEPVEACFGSSSKADTIHFFFSFILSYVCA